MELNKIFLKSSEDMSEIPDRSVDLIVTSPPYNIDIKYGNTTKNGKILSSKGAKYKDNLEEEEYRKMLLQVFNECKRVLKDDGSIWINIKNRYKNGIVQTPSWIENYFTDMFLKNVVISYS